MKKLLAFLLAATMIVAMFAIPAAAEDTVNYEEEFKFIKKAPEADGKVEDGEYGTVPVHSFKDAKDQFIYGTKAGHEHDQYDESDWDVDFYGAWDKDYIYMAWVIEAADHVGIPEKDFNGNNSWGEEDYGYMWMYSCIQFIFTPGAPKDGETAYQTSEYGGDYLEVGLALTAENNPIRIAWSKPVNSPSLDPNEWDAAIVRDDAKKTTTYEVRIPWSKTGVNEIGNGAQFGFTYAVASQEYEVKRGMIEWQDGVLGGKKADKAAVITLTGNKDIQKEENSHEVPTVTKTEGTLPEAAKDAVQIVIDGVNTSITGEKAYLYTDPSVIGENNNGWATSILLKPVDGEEGVYEVAETKTGSGATFSFDSEIEDGMLAISVHSDGSGVGKDRSEAAKALGVGTKLGLFGVDLEKADTLYSNAMLYVIGGESTGDTSTEESTDTSTEESTEASTEESTETSVEESTATSTEESKATSEDTSAPVVEEEGSLLWLWIVIGVVVVAGVVVAVIVLKKKN